MQDSVIKVLRDERSDLLRKLNAIESMLAVYGEAVGASVAKIEPRKGVSRRGPDQHTTTIRNRVQEYLTGRNGAPFPTRKLVERLMAEHIEVRGKNPVASLSAILSHNKETFRSIGREGWVLVDKNVEGSDASTSEPSNITEDSNQGTIFGQPSGLPPASAGED